MGKTRTITIDIDGASVKVQTNMRTHLRNFIGWYVWIDRTRYYINTLQRSDAIVYALNKAGYSDMAECRECHTFCKRGDMVMASGEQWCRPCWRGSDDIDADQGPDDNDVLRSKGGY